MNFDQVIPASSDSVMNGETFNIFKLENKLQKEVSVFMYTWLEVNCVNLAG